MKTLKGKLEEVKRIGRVNLLKIFGMDKMIKIRVNGTEFYDRSGGYRIPFDKIKKLEGKEVIIKYTEERLKIGDKIGDIIFTWNLEPPIRYNRIIEINSKDKKY